MDPWLRNKSVQRWGGGWLERVGLWFWSMPQIYAISSRKTKKAITLLKEQRREGRAVMSTFEQYIVYSIAQSSTKIAGAFAEVGVFRGASAKLICEAKGDRHLHLFDTFEGLPPTTAGKDTGIHREHQYACSLENVKAYLSSYSGVSYHKGLFPDSAHDVPEQKYAFAHFDTDLYASTKSCLEYFYPRMTPGAAMMSHDYDILDGVNLAFQEFFADKPETIIELPTTQCLVIKL